jgi:uncharacterized protein involved in outer membrane biogenesis
MRIWIAAGLTVAALALASLVAIRNLDSYLNRNKDWLAERAEQSLGRKITFAEVGVSVRQGLGVRVRDLQVADDPGFSAEPVLSTRSALVRIRVLPALFGRYEIARVVLEHPVINVVRTKQGLNLSTFGRRADAETDQGGGGGAGAAVVVAYASIEDGTLRYVDRRREPALRADVADIDFTASDLSLDRPLAFELDAAALDARDQNVHVKGSVGPFTDPGGSFPFDVQLRAERVPAQALQRIPEIAAALPSGLSASGPLTLSATAQGTPAAVRLTATLDAGAAHVTYVGLLDKPEATALSLGADVRSSAEGLAVDDVKIVLHTAEIHAKGNAASDGSTYDLAIGSAPLTLAGWEKLVPAAAAYALGGSVALDLRASADAKGRPPLVNGTVALRDFAARAADVPAVGGLSTTITVDGDQARITPADFSLGGSPAKLGAQIRSIRAGIADVAFSVAELRPAALSGGGIRNEASADLLRDFRLEAKLSTGTGPEITGRATSPSGTLKGIVYQSLSADLRYAGRRAVLEPLSLSAFGGTLKGRGVYDMSSEPPAFSMDTRVEGVRFGDAAAAFVPAAGQVLAGTFSGDLSLAGKGSEWQALSRALSGSGRVDIREGALKDVNLADGVLQGLTGVPGLTTLLTPELRAKYPRVFASPGNTFDALEASFRIVEGKIVSDDMALRALDYAVSGKGGIGLDGSVDISAVLALSEKFSSDVVASMAVAGSLADATGRLRLPFRLQGPLSAGRVQPDLGFVAQSVQRAAVQGFLGRALGGSLQRPTPSNASGSSGSSGSPGSPASTSASGAGSAGATAPVGKQSPPAGKQSEKAAPAETPPTAAESPTEKLLRGMEGLLGR